MYFSFEVKGRFKNAVFIRLKYMRVPPWYFMYKMIKLYQNGRTRARDKGIYRRTLIAFPGKNGYTEKREMTKRGNATVYFSKSIVLYCDMRYIIMSVG